MICSVCKKELKSAILNNVEINYCPQCLGLWFEENELRWAKDEKDEDLRWLDVDLWENEKKFKISKDNKICPVCRMPLYEVNYGSSNIKVDVCNLCHGIWLDRGEFKKIIDYLHQKADKEIIENYYKNLFKQLGEVFIGPEPVKDEILDFLVVFKFLKYRFLVRHPVISKMILGMVK